MKNVIEQLYYRFIFKFKNLKINRFQIFILKLKKNATILQIHKRSNY